ncbi:MAG: hypothetical protein ABII80_03300 [bacterium]
MKMKGLVQSLGLVTYITMIAAFIYNSNKVFDKVNQFVGPLLFLTLFVVSAMVCSLIMFYEPYQLFAKDKKKEAIELVIATTKFLGIFLLMIIVGMMVWGR